jgi:hypothetical protein
MTEETVPLDRLAKIYRKIRTNIATLTQEYDTKVEELKAQQDEITNAMKASRPCAHPKALWFFP